MRMRFSKMLQHFTELFLIPSSPRGRRGSLATHWSHYTLSRGGTKTEALHDPSTYKWWSMIKTSSWWSSSWPCSSGPLDTLELNWTFMSSVGVSPAKYLQIFVFAINVARSHYAIVMFAMKRCQKLHVLLITYTSNKRKSRISVTPHMPSTFSLVVVGLLSE